MTVGLGTSARSVVVRAYEYAVRDRAGRIREEHLLEGVLDRADGRRLLGAAFVVERGWVQLLEELGASRRKGGVTVAEEAALSGWGIDVDALVHGLQDQLGPQALEIDEPARPHWWRRPVFSEDALRVLSEAERHLSSTAGRLLGVEHLALGLVTAPTALSDSLARRGVSEAGVQQLLVPSVSGGSR